MINILLPAAGSSLFFDGYFFPKPLIEICGETMIEKLVANYSQIEEKRLIFFLIKRIVLIFIWMKPVCF